MYETEDPLEDDLDLADLDDVRDRDELRRRYYGLLQELRVVLPGVQVLLAFLFAVPFAERFGELDDIGRAGFGVAIVSAMVAVVCMLTPAAFHRVGPRTARMQRLRWSIRLTMIGMSFLAVAMVAALWTVARFVYGSAASWVVTVPIAVAIPILWAVVPFLVGRRHEH